MNEEKEIGIGLLTDDKGTYVIALQVGEERVILDLDEAGGLFDVLGDALDAAGFFDDEEPEGEQGVRVCH